VNKRTRQFVFIAAGILVFGLGTGLVASYMGGLQGISLIGRDGPAELDYIPGDTRALAYANVRQVMDSQLRQKLMQLHPEAGGARRFCEALRDRGLLCKETHEHTIRLAPPLVITREELDWALGHLSAVLADG
jgi:hypothetical protein